MNSVAGRAAIGTVHEQVINVFSPSTSSEWLNLRIVALTRFRSGSKE